MYDEPGHDSNWWDTAQICMNGHTVTYVLLESPKRAQNHCHECGAPTITTCPTCGASIRGYFHRRDIIDWTFEYSPPNYCYECGGIFPWTEKKLAAAAEWADELNLSEQERTTVKEKLPDIVGNTPTAQISAFKLSKLLSKAGGVVAGIVREIAVDVASETAKRVLLGP